MHGEAVQPSSRTDEVLLHDERIFLVTMRDDVRDAADPIPVRIVHRAADEQLRLDFVAHSQPPGIRPMNTRLIHLSHAYADVRVASTSAVTSTPML